MKCQTSHWLRVSHRVFLQYTVSWGTWSVKHHTDSESVTEYSFSIPSREGHEVSNITLSQSPSIPSVYRLVRDMKCQTSHWVSHRVFLQYTVSWGTWSVKHHTESVTEYSFSIPSREGHEVSNITLSQSPSIPSVYRLVRDMKCQTSHWLRVSHRMLPLINLTYFSLLPYRLWMPIYLLQVFNNIIIQATLHMACFHHIRRHRKAHICCILHLHVCCYLAPGSIEELLSGQSPERSCTCLLYGIGLIVSFIRCCVHCCGLQMSHVSFDFSAELSLYLIVTFRASPFSYMIRRPMFVLVSLFLVCLPVFLQLLSAEYHNVLMCFSL